MTEAGVNPDIRCRDLTDDDVKKISAVIDETQTVEGDLRREDRSEHQETYRRSDATEASVTERGLPVRGQKTKTNARTRKGPKRDSSKQEEIISL